jgi:hypothetical protein
MSCHLCFKILNLNNVVNTLCNHQFCKKCFFNKSKLNNHCPKCEQKLFIQKKKIDSREKLINDIINSGEHQLWLL